MLAPESTTSQIYLTMDIASDLFQNTYNQNI